MERNALFYRLLFFFISLVATTTYELSGATTDTINALLLGISKGALLFLFILAFEFSIKRVTLRSFNTALVGVAVGMLMGYIICSSIDTAFSIMGLKLAGDFHSFFILFTYLTSLYMGINATFAASEVWWLSIPFVQLAPAGQALKKEILLDITAIEDIRLIDLARLGILDHQLVIPSFVLREIQKGMEALDETTKTRYRKCFENVKRLENITTLGLQHKEFHTSELDDMATKLVRTAKLVQAHIITSELSSLKQGEEEGVTIISIEAIANAIKPSAQRGEVLSIKIQRPGKEPKQGVGYLEDGTMVVVNGGGEFLGETIKTQVLSQKYSSSGKIIFCNALQDDKIPIRFPQVGDEGHSTGSPYTAASHDKREESYVPPLRKRIEPQHERQSYDPWNRH